MFEGWSSLEQGMFEGSEQGMFEGQSSLGAGYV